MDTLAEYILFIATVKSQPILMKLVQEQEHSLSHYKNNTIKYKPVILFPIEGYLCFPGGLVNLIACI